MDPWTVVVVVAQFRTVTFAGAAPMLLDGVAQLNIRLDDNTPTGMAQPLVISIGANAGPPTATVAVF
jgi:hypothetical protein